MYSTPTIYLDYVHKSDLTWTVKNDDFLPNADDPYDFWTGTQYNNYYNCLVKQLVIVETFS